MKRDQSYRVVASNRGGGRPIPDLRIAHASARGARSPKKGRRVSVLHHARLLTRLQQVSP